MRTAASGKFLAPSLPVGSWQITVSQPGFQSIVRKLDLTVATAIEVTSAAPMVNPEESADATIIGEKSVSTLPIRGRNFVEFAQLTPGVPQEGDRVGLLVAGQRSINSNVSVDGMDFNDSPQDNQRGGNEAVFFFPQIAIREFQMLRSGANAEIGRTNAGSAQRKEYAAILPDNPQARYFNSRRGFSICTVTPAGWQTDFHTLPYVSRPGAPLSREASFLLRHGATAVEPR